VAQATLLLILAAGLIYLCAEGFTNGVEWLGARLKLGQTATGTILAALGTALPESVVTLVATAFAVHPDQQQIGIGAAMGGPLALSTVAYAVVGATLLLVKRTPHLDTAEQRRLSRDQWAFLFLFAFKIGLGLIEFPGKEWCGWGFLIAYALYVRTEMLHPSPHAEEGDLEPLKIRRRDGNPGLGWILAQCVGAAAVTFLASRLFVDQLEILAPAFGLSPQLTALLLSPIATELPETMNAVIWVRQGKDRLALANISGSMMVQATVPTSFGLFFTPWLLDRWLLLAGAATALSILYLTQLFRRPSVNPKALAVAVLPLLGLLGRLLIAR
jgi:cation:H+ antiporter